MEQVYYRVEYEWRRLGGPASEWQKAWYVTPLDPHDWYENWSTKKDNGKDVRKNAYDELFFEEISFQTYQKERPNNA